MKRRLWLRLLAGILLLLCGTYANFLPFRPPTTFELQAGPYRVPVTRFGYADAPRAVVFFHAIAANRTLVEVFGAWLERDDIRVYLVDLPGHGDNREPFSFSRSEGCAVLIVETLVRQEGIRLENTALVGHSLGGAIAIKLADYFPAAATIAISPAPMFPLEGVPVVLVPISPPRRSPGNLLILIGQFEASIAAPAARKLVYLAGGEREDLEDFRQRRAVALKTIPLASHTSLVFDREAALVAESWFLRAVDRPQQPTLLWFSRNWYFGSAVGILGFLLLFSAAVEVTSRHKGVSDTNSHSQPRGGLLYTACALAALVAVLLQLSLVTLQPVVRMFSGDYLASVLMLTGILLLMSRSFWAPPSAVVWNFRSISVASLLSIATMLALGAWLDWHITDAWLNAPRWWRFGVLVPLMVPYCLAEEIALGSPVSPELSLWHRRRAQALRLGRFLVLRGILWLMMAFAVVALRSGEILIVLLGAYLAAFSIAQRLGMDAIRRRTGSAAAAAVFGAILAAWFIAAVFPLT